MLNRPFIYGGVNVQQELVRDVLNFRYEIIDMYPDLRPRVSKLLDKSGKIVKVN